MQADEPGPGGSLPGTTTAPWSEAEQGQLDQLLAQYSRDGVQRSHMELVLLVASCLPGKTARDVALRMKWLDTQQQQHQDMQRKRKTAQQHAGGESGGAGPLSPSGGKKGQGRAGGGATAVKKEPGALQLRPATSLPLAASSRHGSSGNLAGLARAGTLPPPAAAGSLALHGYHPSSPMQAAGGAPLPFMYPSSSSGNAAGGNSDSDGHVQLGMDVGRNNEPPNPLPPPVHIPPPGTMGPKEAGALLDTLLEHCCAVLGNIKHNMGQCKVVENSDLLVRYRDNLMAMLQHMGAMPGVMQQMPPLPVQLNLELAARVLPPPRMPPLMMGPHSGVLPVMGPPMPMPYPGMAPYSYPPGPGPAFPGSAAMPAGPFSYPGHPPPPCMPPGMPAPPAAASQPGAGGGDAATRGQHAQEPGPPPPFSFPPTVHPFPVVGPPGMGMGMPPPGMMVPPMPMPFPPGPLPSACGPVQPLPGVPAPNPA